MMIRARMLIRDRARVNDSIHIVTEYMLLGQLLNDLQTNYVPLGTHIMPYTSTISISTTTLYYMRL